MIRNYIVTALRSFLRNKLFTAINILGLTIGISAALVIYLIVHHEMNFDKFEKDRDRIYRVVSVMKFPDLLFKNSGVALPLPSATRSDVTGIAECTHFITWSPQKVAIPSSGNVPKIYKQQPDIIFADEHYFNLFNYDWLAGSPQDFKQPNQVVLTESRAKSYFSFSDPSEIIGQRVTYEDSTPAVVVGVVKDLTQITDLTFKEFISLSTTQSSSLKSDYDLTEWGGISSSSQFFVKLNEGTLPSQVESQFPALQKKYYKQDDGNTQYLLEPLSDIHFNPDYGNYDLPQADTKELYGLMMLAAFLLLLGCINFINLNTAQASQRAKEIGIRKTIGSSKKHLIFQYLGETFILTSFATALSLLLVPLILKIFSEFIPPGISFSKLEEWNVILFLFALVLIVTLLSGIYPAWILSGYNPVVVLKNAQASSKSRRAWLRKTLTVTQFVGAQFFIIATILVSKQIYYSLNKDLGYRKDAIVNFTAPYGEKVSKRQVLLNKLKSIPELEQVCVGGDPPASAGTSSTTMNFEDGDQKKESTVQVKYGDKDYFNLYGMKLLAGRYPEPADSVREYVINNTYAKFLGFQNPQDALGKMIGHNKNVYPIVGVVNDFNSKSTRAAIGPLVYSADKMAYYYFHILLKPENANGTVWQTAISKMQNAWKEVYPEEDFNYHFFDQSIAGFYQSEQNTSKLLRWASGVAILISCLGLLGLAIYTTNQRTKEIGVRKVLGASVSQIVLLLSTDFMMLILLAFVIAVPLAWWAMHSWLENFAYRTTLDWWTFAAGGLLMLLIAGIILCLRTFRAASVNPVKSLRSE